MAVKDSLRSLRYAAVSISLFGLLLAVGTWSFQVWLGARPPTRLYLISFTLGAVCWLFGLIMFIITWILEDCADKG
jgi:hypothetical protein